MSHPAVSAVVAVVHVEGGQMRWEEKVDEEGSREWEKNGRM